MAGFIDPQLFRLSCAIKGLELKQKTGLMLTRGATNSKLMAIISEFTGRRYKRNEVTRAIEDGKAFKDVSRQVSELISQQPDLSLDEAIKIITARQVVAQ